MKLERLGWDDFFAESFRSFAEEGYAVGRVYLEHRGGYWLYTEKGEIKADLSGKMRFQALERQDLPAVGDWVVIRLREGEQKASVHAILPRKSKFSRKVAGSSTVEQIIAANIDTVMLVCGLDHDFNLRRIERYLVTAQDSGAQAVILLNKADLLGEAVEERLREVAQIAPDVPVIHLSAARNEGFAALSPFIKEGQTIALLGSSGVGKSTITNRLLGEEVQKVREVRESDSRGRHTTTRRELIVLPEGGLIIDTPGMRELQLWVSEEGMQNSFVDVEMLVKQCYYSNCGHGATPGCAVEEALENGTLDPERWENHLKLHKELAYLIEKQDVRASQNKKKNIKKLTREFNKTQKRRFTN